MGETTTDADGAFTFDHLAAGKYVVVSNIKRVGSGRQQVIVGDAPATVMVTLKAPGERKVKGKAKTTQTQTRADRNHHEALAS